MHPGPMLAEERKHVCREADVGENPVTGERAGGPGRNGGLRRCVALDG